MSVISETGLSFDAEDAFERFERLMPSACRIFCSSPISTTPLYCGKTGALNELLIGESRELNLQQIPGITHVASCSQALELARSEPRFNLIVTNLAVGEMNAAQLALEVKKLGRGHSGRRARL